MASKNHLGNVQMVTRQTPRRELKVLGREEMEPAVESICHVQSLYLLL